MTIKLLFFGLLSLFKSRNQLMLENAALRYQLGVLKRRKIQLHFKRWDRILLVWFSRNMPNWRQLLTIVEPTIYSLAPQRLCSLLGMEAQSKGGPQSRPSKRH